MSPRFLLMPLAALCLVACAVDADQAVVGSWSPDSNTTKLPEAANAFLSKQQEQLFANTSLKVHSDHTYELLMLNRTVEGKWSIKDGNLVLTGEKGNEKSLKLSADRKQATLSTTSPLGEVVIGLRKTG